MVVGVLDPVDDRVVELVTSAPRAPVEHVLLEQRVERLHRRVIAGRRDPTHRPGQPVGLQHGHEISRAELAAPVRVNDRRTDPPPSSNRRAQRQDRQVSCHAGVDRVADDPFREQVLDQAGVELALAGPVLGVGVGPERPFHLSMGGFLRPALRTGRATSTASGSPRVQAAGAGDPVVTLVHGVGILVPR